MGYRIHPSVLFTDLDDGTGVLLHLDSKYYYTLNDTGTLIWRSLMENEGAGEDELAQTLATTVAGADAAVLRNDLRELFREMVAEQILLEEHV